MHKFNIKEIAMLISLVLIYLGVLGIGVQIFELFILHLGIIKNINLTLIPIVNLVLGFCIWSYFMITSDKNIK